MGILTWIVFGLIVGIVAKMLMPGRDPGGFVITAVLGILGALVGGFIGSALGMGPVSGFNLGSLALAVLGAVILLYVYRVARR